MPDLRISVVVALRICVAAACCIGIWLSFSFAVADYRFRQDSEDSTRAAISVVPDGWRYYMRLAQFDRANASQLLKSSLQINPYDAQADIELALLYESDGDFASAEKQLLQAYKIDNTYIPRWSLANFYFRRNNLAEFWTWARKAADMPAGDVGALLDLCWRADPNPARITAAILNERPEFLRQYVSFLLIKGQPRAAAGIVQQLIRFGDTESDLPYMFLVVNRLVAANEASAAFDLWHRLIQDGWVVADWTAPNNAGFQRAPLPVSLDWSFPEYQGLHSWPGPSGLETEFAGNEPDDSTIAEQFVILSPGSYLLTYDYQASNIQPSTGIRWQLLDPTSQKVLAASDDLSSEKSKKPEMHFVVSPGAPLLKLQLRYRRTLGTVRVSGMLNMQGIQIRKLPS